MDHFKRDQAEVVRWAARAIPADYGRFAPWVFDAASDGDDLATALLDETCAQLGMLLEGMTQLGADRIALLGGIGTRLAPVWATSIWSPPSATRWRGHPVCQDGGAAMSASLSLAGPTTPAGQAPVSFTPSEEFPCPHP